jgi:C1A family cysteine protease
MDTKYIPYCNKLFQDPYDKRDYIFQSSAPLTTTLLAVDHTNMMSPVKDQGRLGSCVAFATCAVKEWQENIEYREYLKTKKRDFRNKKLYDFSEQWVYYKCKDIDIWPNQEGTSIFYAMKILNKFGVPNEEGWVYNDMVKGKPATWASSIATWAKIQSYSRILDINGLRSALMLSPVAIGVGVFREMFTVGSDGIVKDPKNPNEFFGGHAIACVGFSDAKRLVKFKNSWSSKWGRQGYGYISYDYINKYMWDAWTCKDSNIKKLYGS